MKGRQDVWSSQAVRSFAARFVPVAEEIARVERTPFLRPIIEAGRHVAAGCATGRGIYAFTASGDFLASTHEAAPILVARTLERALERWRALPAVVAEGGRPVPRFPPFPSWPRDGLVLKVTVRDLSRSRSRRRTRHPEWNQDNVWFRPREMRSLVPASAASQTSSGSPRIGETHDVPGLLIRRLARFHLLDQARGGSAAFGDDQIVRAQLRATVTGFDAARGVTELRYDGDTIAKGRFGKGWRGMALTLLGFARFDRASRRFVAFDLIALGERFGHTTHNGRTDEGASSRVGFLVRRVDTSKTQPADCRLPPAFYGHYRWME